MRAEVPLSDKNRLLFGAGFVFGVMFTLVILALVTVTLAGDWTVLAREGVVTLVGGIVFTGILGTGLYLLAFPENRIEVPVAALFDAEEGEEER